MAKNRFCPPSLVQHFDAPEDFKCIFGWMCGYSADASFLNDALERLTRETKGQRASRGEISVALMLDPGHPAIEPTEVPGLAHLPLLSFRNKPFRLLHAKVALLGFRHVEKLDHWRLRLIVSTGNWTRQTLEESLDLAWSIEVDSDELGRENSDLPLRCADIMASWSMFEFLQSCFDMRLLNASTAHGMDTRSGKRESLDAWLAQCAKYAGSETRFFDNRSKSLLEQLPDLVKSTKVEGKRNYLAMGSGFFEGAPFSEQPSVPKVLESIVKQLQASDLLIQKPSVDVIVNPVACQSVASALPAMMQRGWQVRAASKMEAVFGSNAQRSLHAKFLFSANTRETSSRCGKPWVYLGSGNLTGPGFDSKSSSSGGNLEAGVVFSPGALYWDAEDAEPENAVTHLLPIQWDSEIENVDALSMGGDMPPPGDPFLAPPWAWLNWQAAEHGGYLCAPEQELSSGDVLDTAGIPCNREGQKFVWDDAPPLQVRVRWYTEDGEHECRVPVRDEFGRLAATPLTAIDFDEAWWALVGFPAAMSEGEEDNLDEEGEMLRIPQGNGQVPQDNTASYPVRQMMELIERIADRQSAVEETDWLAWCARLEQTLSRVADSPVVDYFKTLGLNPLSPLLVPVFRPDFAEDASTSAGRLYESVLERIGEQWGIADLMPLGGTTE
ncbi:hypothetical protein [Chromobacterium sp. IIBBL 290-4]|uniref:hypothetical protein n=1 Tax=Chromobacterium sp. IIBBL 290-4 TaxID=2953890 RepID=UPI0020B71727|nr:hypothetical protein [Chromobacterium sp. IIBBL 290-4]UTH75182.1 hypothetical protein NKT35_03530 [Chromobacterium sp. IIBBL 290-4]